MADPNAIPLLLCRLPTCVVGLPLESVIETMRPLPVEELTVGSPSFVKGVSVIRGTPVPVIDAGQLIGGHESEPGRLVTIKTGDRIVALAVNDVVGVRTIRAESLGALPPLLHGARSETVAALGTLDSELLVVLHACLVLQDLPGQTDGNHSL